MQPDLTQASTYVRILTGSTLTPMTWQVFDDDQVRRDQTRAAHFHAALSAAAYRLSQANDNGCGVFATVNATDGQGRRAANVTAIRALWIDTDGFIPSAFHLQPSMVVRSSAGVHAYWCLTDSMPLHDFRDAQRRLIKHYNSDSKIHNLDRVMRVPGFLHRKEGLFAVYLADDTGCTYTVAQVLADLPPLPRPAPPKPRARSLAAVDWSTLDVVGIFAQAGFAPRDIGGGKYAVICPWTGEHSHPDFDGRSTSTVIWSDPATFYCSHAHCDGRRLADVLELIGYRPSEADVIRAMARSARARYDRTVQEVAR